jgi:putative tricarboxylic transport membrane protein
MDVLHLLMQGFAVALTPTNLMYGAFGALLGTAVGVLPGLGKATTIALLLPVTYQIGDPVGAFIMFGGVFYGAGYGGSTAAILINTPGEADSVISTIDGHQMVLRGRAGAALTTAAIGSFVAGSIGTLCLVLLAQPMVKLALSIGPVEYLAIFMIAFSLVSMLGGTFLKGAFATVLGLAIGTVGIDLNSGTSRFTFNVPELFDGFDFVVVAVGLFALSEVLFGLGQLRAEKVPKPAVTGKLRMTRDEFRHSWPAWGRGTVTGFLAGILPGSGSTISTFLAYGVEKTFAKPAVPFGKGAIEGLAGPEAANNSAASGALAPMLFLGIPGSATTAIMLAGIQGYGLPTGPLLLQEHANVVWGLIASLFIANTLLLILNLPLIGIWVKLLSVPPALMYPLVLAVCVLGVYSISSRMLDVYLLLGFGLLGFVFRKVGIPLAPMVLALILAPMIETQLGRAVSASRGDWGVLMTSPVADAGYLLAIVILCTPLIAKFLKRHNSVDVSELDDQRASV